MSTQSVDERPALLGGTPVRPPGAPAWPIDNPAVINAIREAADAGAWAHYVGPHGDELRSILAARHSVAHVWLAASGTAAVELALRGLGVGPGDEVILSAYDFKANFSDILALGAVPVLVDLRADDWHLDIEQVPQALSERTKAVLVSHLHGGSVDIRSLRQVVGNSIGTLEDACQCPGTTIAGRPAGTNGDVGVLSFGGSKLTAAGRGGAVLTNRQDVIERIKRHVMRGNDLSPLSELQAAALVPQWKELDAANSKRRENVRRLAELVSGIPGLRMLTPPDSPRASGYYKVGFAYDPAAWSGLSRDVFCYALRAEGVSFWRGFPGLHRTHASRRFRTAGPLPVADRADAGCVVLHHPVLLGTTDDLREIAVALRKIHAAAPELASRTFEIPPAPWDRDE